eukprot:scaffold140314_cov124-Phaeocystis_antarctica.AAC.1
MGAGSVRRGVGRWRLPRGSAWWQGVAGTAAPGGDGQGQEERRGPHDAQGVPARADRPHRGEGHILP